MTTPVRDPAGALHAFLVRDHARILGMLDRELDVTLDRSDTSRRESWRAFESALLLHMTVEERHLLTPFSRSHPREAAELRAEHAAVRERLAAARHDSPPRSTAILAIATALWAHAEREDHLLYRWAGSAAANVQADLVAELSRRAR